MVSLCGLALSSLFIASNKATVHADTVNDAQSNAITWDSDQDDSQVVQESHTKTEQATPQKADDIQQNATQPAQNSAEMSTVRSSSADRLSATNKSATSVQNSRANLISNVDSAAPSQTPAQQAPVQIKNPNNNQVIVHYVNMRGESIDGVKDGTITINNSATGHYALPAGYSLANNQYTVTDEVQRDVPRWCSWASSADGSPEAGGLLQDVMTDSEAQTFKSQIQDLINKYSMYGKLSYVHNHGSDNAQLSSNDQRSSIMITMGRNLNGMAYDESFVKQLKSEGITNIVGSENALDSSRDHDIFFKIMLDKRGSYGIDAVLYDEIYGFSQDRLRQIYYAMGGTPDGLLSGRDFVQNYVGGEFNVALDDISNYTFTDNSGQVKKVNGNTINLAVTKPQSVNPATDTRCQSQATRTIQINFPDGQVPKSYDGIVDKSGKLVQTVHFTRTATEDALTGNILQYGSWTSDNQDHNFIGFEARTLPRIPGYTLSIKPANA